MLFSYIRLMLRIKASILLFLFAGTTITSFASVHECEGEVTDIDFLSVAECEHDVDHDEQVIAEAKKVDNHSCCHSTKVEDSDSDTEDGCGHSASDDCCSTTQLISLQNEVENEFEVKVSIEQLIILKSIFLEVLTATDLALQDMPLSLQEIPKRDFFASFQVFII